MDPVSFLCMALAVYGILQRDPLAAQEAVQEWQHARRGDESDAAKDRRRRIADAGFTPATVGGPMRQYLSNRLRDYWIDRDARRAADRVAEAVDKAEEDAKRSWRQRVADLMDDEAQRRTAEWRTKPEDGPAPADACLDDPDEWMDPKYDQPHPDEPTITVVHDDEPEQAGDNGWQPGGTFPPPRPASAPTTETDDPERRNPIRVTVTVGSPIPEQRTAPTAPAAELTAGGTMSNALAVQVTGVVSGAAEARAIQAAIEAATAAYRAELDKIRTRINVLGEQTLTGVQMATYSQVVRNLHAAAESAAAAQANAKSCSGEVGPLMGNVAKAFDRINS